MRHFERLLSALAGTALIGLMLVVLVDVIGRNAFNRPLAAGTELTELLLAAMSFMAFPLLAWRQRDITVDLFDFLAGQSLRRMQWALSGVVGAIVYGLLARQATVFAGRAAGSGEATAQLQFPLAWAWWGMAGLAAVASLACLGIAASAFMRKPLAPLDLVGKEPL